MKTVRVEYGRAQEVFAAGKADLADKFHPDVLASVVEVADDVPVNVGDDWDGATFITHVQPPRPKAEDLLTIELAKPGSVIRAVAILMFKEVNKLRAKNGDAPYTMAQFTAALAAELS